MIYRILYGRCGGCGAIYGNLPVALFQKLDYVSENLIELLFFEHPSKKPSKCSIPKPNGYHQWIQAEVLPLASAQQVWKGPFQVHFR